MEDGSRWNKVCDLSDRLRRNPVTVDSHDLCRRNCKSFAAERGEGGQEDLFGDLQTRPEDSELARVRSPSECSVRCDSSLGCTVWHKTAVMLFLPWQMKEELSAAKALNRRLEATVEREEQAVREMLAGSNTDCLRL